MKDLLDKIPEYVADFKDDDVACELLKKMQDHLESKANGKYIDAAAQRVFDFTDIKIPIFGSVKEPTSFLDGFDKAASLLTFFFSVIYRSDCNARVKEYLLTRLNAAIETADRPDYVPLFRRAVMEKETEAANDILSVVARMRQKEMERTIDHLEHEQKRLQLQIGGIDHDRAAAEEAELQAKLDAVVMSFESWQATKTLPDDFVIHDVFKGYPEDQFQYDIRELKQAVSKGSELRVLQRELKRVVDALEAFRAEIVNLKKVDHIEPDMGTWCKVVNNAA